MLFVKEKTIYQSKDALVKKVDEEGKLCRETEIKIKIGKPSVNTKTKKIYICPYSGKVFGDNTHPNPQDAIYDWVSKCPENTERANGMRVKRFFVSEDPAVIKNYVQEHKKTISKTVFSSGVTGKLFNDTARYTLMSYDFDGTKFYGGVGTFLVKGEKLSSSGDIQATAFVEKTVDIKPKNCGAPVGGNPTKNGFPGLLGKTIDMGNNDVWGSVSGNVLCTTCEGTTEEEIEDEINLFKNGDIEGNLFAGPIAMPTPDSPPADASPFLIDGELALTAGIQAAGSPCTFDGTTTHCNVSSITLNSVNLTVDSSSGPVNLYVSGDISMSGTASIVHSGHPWDLTILGNPEDQSTSSCSQTFTLNGGATTSNIFVHAPDACVGINGGSQKPDIYGAVWCKHFDGSRSNNAEIEVPDDMGDIGSRKDPGYGISITDFVALGARNWKSFQLQNSP